MKLPRRIFGLLLALILLAGCLSQSGFASAPSSALTILFTHDTHDHFLPMPAEGGGEYGGYTRLTTALSQQRNTPCQLDGNQTEAFPTITVDAGDFSMGSLFQAVYATEAPELRALGAMGYDVTTLGNHEYDYRAQGLADMLHAAVQSGDPLPKIVQANYRPKREDGYVQEALDNYGVTDYTMIERDGLRVAVFGLLGADADASAPMSGMEFEPIADAARRVVAQIQETEKSDFIICLSHSGTDPNSQKSEDELLAKSVDGIDVIISGHTHSVTPVPIQVNNTLIVSCGPYTENLGRLTLEKDVENGEVRVLEYKLLPIDATVAEDPAMSALAEEFKSLVSAEYLEDYGMTFDEVLAQAPFDFTPISRFGVRQEEDSLGNLIADSYLHAVKEAEGEFYVPVDFAVVASGVVRASFVKGDLTTSDAFNVSSLGVGGDGTPGYPLISVYITGKELKDAFEVDASVTPLMPAAQLYGAGMAWTFNPNRMIFNKVVSCAQIGEDGTQVPIEDEKLYRVVTGLYSGQMLGAVNGKSFGILTITPKDKQGDPVTDFERQIIHNQNGAEVKEWYALASYLKSMGTVSQEYAQPQGRKVVAPSWNPMELLKNPNWTTLVALGLLLLFVTIIVLVVRRVFFGAHGGRRGYRTYRGR